MRITEFKKRFINNSIDNRTTTLSNMKNDIENSKKTRTYEEHLNFLGLIKWCEENLNKDL